MSMATGIVSVAARADGATLVSDIFLAAAVASYAVLAVALLLRAMMGREGLLRQLRDPGDALGFLTFVAASDVIASRVGERWLELALWIVALAGWLVLGGFALRAQRGPDARRARRLDVRGQWLLAAVATQSLAVVAARLASAYRSSGLLAGAWAWWVLGIAFYASVAVLLARRASDEGLELEGDHWIVMGALGIMALAASSLLLAGTRLGWAAGVNDVARAGEVALWCGATIAIPALVVAEARAWPPSLGFERWATVFPLGMYATATYALAARTGAGWLRTVATVFLWIAVASVAATRDPRRSRHRQ